MTSKGPGSLLFGVRGMTDKWNPYLVSRVPSGLIV